MTDRTAEDQLEELRAVARDVLSYLENHPSQPMAVAPLDHPFRQLRRITPPESEELSRTSEVVEFDRVLRTAKKDERALAALAILAKRRKGEGLPPLRRRVAGGISR